MDVHESHAEHHDDLDLLPPAHFELQQHGDRQGEDGHVQTDLDGGADPREQVDVDTGARGLACPALPEERDRCTLEDHGEGVGDAEADRDTHEREDDEAESSRREDPQVEGQQGELDECFGGHVEYLGDVEELEGTQSL